MSTYPTDSQAREFHNSHRVAGAAAEGLALTGLVSTGLVSTGRRAACHVVLLAGALMMVAGAGIARGDVLVTHEGERITTQGPWTVKGRQIVFTGVTGTLSAVRLSEIDLEASEIATREANAPPPAPEEAPAAPVRERRAPVLTITDADIPRGTPTGGGPAEALVGRLRNALRFDDIEGAMQQVLLEGTSPGVRAVIRDVFQQVMDRKLRDIVFEPTPAGDDGTPGAGDTVQDGVTYRPNAPVVGRLRVLLEPSIEDRDADVAEASFFVGDRLGTYMIVAPLVVPDTPTAADDEPESGEAEEGAGAAGNGLSTDSFGASG